MSKLLITVTSNVHAQFQNMLPVVHVHKRSVLLSIVRHKKWSFKVRSVPHTGHFQLHVTTYVSFSFTKCEVLRALLGNFGLESWQYGQRAARSIQTTTIIILLHMDQAFLI